ncbi:HTH_48 domain-containing protein [Trichonephila clavipes]|uniref:HTH_48 domain-containing protein n=1 Tax=Trichonephila clavipes TaxID=2585209 RepID=A0A8X6T0W3_TRICX|nr:HTH_48 domain-containing protein [Trichonephila clavipes]
MASCPVTLFTLIRNTYLQNKVNGCSTLSQPEVEGISKKAGIVDQVNVHFFEVNKSHAKCEIQSVTLFLTARNLSAADIHHQITEVYGIEAVSDSKVRKWVRKFKDERTNVHDEERSGRSSIITNQLSQAVETKFV